MPAACEQSRLTGQGFRNTVVWRHRSFNTPGLVFPSPVPRYQSLPTVLLTDTAQHINMYEDHASMYSDGSWSPSGLICAFISGFTTRSIRCQTCSGYLVVLLSEKTVWRSDAEPPATWSHLCVAPLFLLGEPPPNCFHCGDLLTVRHVLLHYSALCSERRNILDQSTHFLRLSVPLTSGLVLRFK